MGGRSGDRASESAFAEIRWNALRSLLVLLTGVIALVVPKFSVFIALVGASSGAALTFVLPSAFHLKLRHHELNRLRRWREMACIAFGLLGGGVGTMSALHDLHAAFAKTEKTL